jgi:ribosome-associated protein YbcJ (S4-like RNA binding protein)
VLIAGGAVRVNGEAETRRGRKLRAGDQVAIDDAVVHLEPQHPA